MFNWKRFLCFLDQDYSLDDAGFLSNPESQYGEMMNPNVFDFESIREKKCVVVLGEPGIGKSTLLLAASKRAEEINQDEMKVLYFNLGEHASEDSLVSNILRHPYFTAPERVVLFLDGLDECKVRLSNVSRLIKRELRCWSTNPDKYSLRISCRTADWPSTLTEFFCGIWGEAEVVTAKVVPLRRVDVHIAASSIAEIDADHFIDSVIEVGCQSLAIKPVTLKFLLEHFQQHHQLTTNAGELYESGCLALCTENNPERLDTGDTGSLSPAMRLEVASRIAAVTVFCSRPTITREAAQVQSNALLKASEIEGFREFVHDNHFIVSQQSIWEVLGTGLFAGNGSDRFTFAHQSYAEYLAARFLLKRNIPNAEIVKVIFSNNEELGSHVHPQLLETCTWIFPKNQELFSVALLNDPQSVLKSDFVNTEDSVRQELLARLLELFRLKQISISGWDEMIHYSKLRHSNMAAQLMPYLEDRTVSDDARQFAVYVADACNTTEVQAACLKIALDPTEKYNLRCQAARFLGDNADDEHLSQLKAMYSTEAEENEDGRLRTIVLKNLWPKIISTAELFGRLIVPKRNEYGDYGYFVSHELPDLLPDSDLPIALNWIASLNEAELHEFSIRELVEKLVSRAWKLLLQPGILESMVLCCHTLMKNHLPVLNIDEAETDQESKRRAISECLVTGFDGFELDPFSLVHHPPKLVRGSDIAWVLIKITAENSSSKRAYWAKVLTYVVDLNNSEQFTAINSLVESIPELKAEFESDLAALVPDSPEYVRRRALREKNLQQLEELKKKSNRPPLDPPPAVRVSQLIELCEQGDLKAWFELTRDLQLEASDTHYRHDLVVDITTLPGWQKATDHERLRMVKIAKDFLENEQCMAPEYFDKNTRPIWDWAGYKALHLLAKQSPADFDALSQNAWDNWAASIVDHISLPNKDDESEEFDIKIKNRCAERSPAVVAESISKIIRSRPQRETTVILPQILKQVWNESIRRTLFELATDRELNCQITFVLIDKLLEMECPETYAYAKSILALPVPKGGRARGLIIMIGRSFMSSAPQGAWQVLWPIFESEPSIARLIVEGVAPLETHSCNIARTMEEKEIADLFVWLEKQYPISIDPVRHRAGIVGRRESVADYRDSALRLLEYRGSLDSISALRAISQKLPHLDRIHRVIARAKQNALRSNWQPLSVSEFMELTNSQGKTLVKNESELQALVLESLKRLNTKLQAETPAAPDLWDTSVGKPKDENHLSDYVKRHLESDLVRRGVISLREVEIRRGEGRELGERTDVHVTGLIPGVVVGEYDQVRVIIEVKGSWHQEVDAAMTTQLRNRYLRDIDCKHGIYLVGWFHCKQWVKSDSRYKHSRKETYDEAASRYVSICEGLEKPPMISAFVLNCSLR